MTIKYYAASTYCDVAVWLQGQLLFVATEGPVLRCWMDGTFLWEAKANENLMFCRGAVQNEQMVTVHQGHQTGAAILLNDRALKNLGPTFGVQPVGIDAHEAYIVRSATAYDRVGLVSNGYPSGAPGSSQGLSDVQPDGNIWWADLHRTQVIAGTLLHYPNVRELQGLTPSVTVGQVDPPGIVAVVGGKVTRVLEGSCYEPHVAISPNGRVAICARTTKGAAFVSTTIQELS